MKFCVNYINDEVLNCSSPDSVYIKYPGGKWDLETLSNLIKKNYKIVLHGVIPSSGSILDPKLCDKFEEFSKYIKQTDQQWLSFHLEYKEKYNNKNYLQTMENNLKIIRKYFPNIEILIENMPPVDNMLTWCCDSKTFNEFLNKYNFNMLLDIPHAMISAEFLGITIEEYLSQFDLNRVTEIHFSGLGKTNEGKLYDGHIIANEKDYSALEYALKKCHKLKMITLEFSPTRDYDNQNVAKKYIETRSPKDLYDEQQLMLKRIKELYKSLNIVK